MLLETQKEKFCRMDRMTSSGPFGEVTEWKEGSEFYAVATYQSSTTARVAEKEQKIGTWLVTVLQPIDLERNDVIKRLSDGKTFKIDTPNSNVKTPETATFKFTQAYAYEYSLTGGA